MPSRAYRIAIAAPSVPLAFMIGSSICASVLGSSAAETAHAKPLSAIASFLLTFDIS